MTGVALATLPRGTHTDGRGLALRITKPGAGSWVLKVNGQRRGLGAWPGMDLDGARIAADKLRLGAREARYAGEEWVAPKRRGPSPTAISSPTVPTFADEWAAFLKRRGPTMRPNTIANWRSALAHVLSLWGDKPVAEITRDDVLGVIDALVRDGKRTVANQLRVKLALVFAVAIDDGRMPGPNPADIDMRKRFGKAPKSKRHAAVAIEDAPRTFATIELTDHNKTTRAATRFMVLTASRSDEVRGARWCEIDFDAALWTIPGERMKGGEAHRVPLSSAALVELRRMVNGAGTNPDAWVFPGSKPGAQFGRDRLLKCAKSAIGADATAHGFRRTFKNWAERESGASTHTIELSLAHTVQGVEGHYFTDELLDKRRALMEAWGAFLIDTA